MKIVKEEGLIWSNLENKVKESNNWKAFVCGLCSGGETTGVVLKF